MNINSLSKPTIAERLARQFWRDFRNDGGCVISSGGAGTRPNDVVSAEPPISSGVQLAAIRHSPQLKLSLLRHKQTWASDDDDEDDRDDDDRDESIRDDDDKDDDDEDEAVIRGTPIPYDKVIVQDGVATLFQRGSFAKHLATKPDIRIVAYFDLGAILGRTKSGTCTVHEDALGIQFSCLPPHTSFANDLLISIQRRDVLGAAGAVVPTKQRWQMIAGDRVRIVEEARLVVASVVSFADADSIRVTQSNDLDDNDDLAAAAVHLPLTTGDRGLLNEMGIEASSTSRPGLMIRATKRSHRAAMALEDARRRSLNAEGLIDYTPLEPKGR